MRTKLFTLLILGIFLVQSVAAEISFGELKSVYNIGDEISVGVTLKTSSDYDGFLHAELICDSSSVLFMHIPVSMTAGEEKEINNNISLTQNFLESMTGNCVIDADFGSESAESSSFEISDSINLELNIPESEVKAGESILITGTATRKTLENVNGDIEINFGDDSTSLTGKVENGKFSENFIFPETLKAGNYNLEVYVYERDGNGDISNQGSFSKSIKLIQIPKKIEVAITENSIIPGGNISFKIFLYDSANDEVDGSANVIVKDSYENYLWEKNLRTNELITIPFEKNSTAGYWTIEAGTENLSSKRLFYIEENEEAIFEVVNKTITITNVGNVQYTKAVQIAIGSEVEVKQMDLATGESKKFLLVAPDGTYSISISDGSKTIKLGEISLTGNAVGVEDVNSQVSMIYRYPLVWLFLVSVFGLFIFMAIERIRKSRISFYAPEIKQNTIIRKESKESWANKVRDFELVKLGDKVEAEYSLVLKGEKTNAGIISLKIKNLNKLSSNIKEKIKNVIQNLGNKKAAIMESQEFILIILSPILTRTFKNEIEAIKIANAIKEAISKYPEIDFGIGIHVGEIISKVENGKLKFTAIGNSLSLAKKISDLAIKDVLFSKEIHEKTMNEVKANRFEIEGRELFKIEKISEREKYSGFIEKFKRRL